jgi:hypothetical protein
MNLLAKALVLVFLALGAAACADANGSCDDIVCLEGTSCILEDGNPSCVPDGTDSGNSGGAPAGAACQSTADCDLNLTCLPGVDGVLTCQ